MKIQNNVYRSLTGEPFHVQKINGRTVEFFYMNDTPYLSQNVQKGRFHTWTSNGTDFRLIIEKGFYERFSFFYSEDINELWVNYLVSFGTKVSKLRRINFIAGLLLAAVIITVGYLLNQQIAGLIVAFLSIIVLNMFVSSKMNKAFDKDNFEVQTKVREAMTEEKLEKFLVDQEAYYQEYMKNLAAEYGDEFEDEEEVEQAELTSTPEEVEVVEDTVLNNTVDYSTMTVNDLRKTAKNLEIVGFSTMRKQELIDSILEATK